MPPCCHLGPDLFPTGPQLAPMPRGLGGGTDGVQCLGRARELGSPGRATCSFSTFPEALPDPGLLRNPIQTQSWTWNFQNKNSEATVERFFFFLNDQFRNFIRIRCFQWLHRTGCGEIQGAKTSFQLSGKLPSSLLCTTHPPAAPPKTGQFHVSLSGPAVQTCIPTVPTALHLYGGSQAASRTPRQTGPGPSPGRTATWGLLLGSREGIAAGPSSYRAGPLFSRKTSPPTPKTSPERRHV